MFLVKFRSNKFIIKYLYFNYIDFYNLKKCSVNFDRSKLGRSWVLFGGLVPDQVFSIRSDRVPDQDYHSNKI